MAASDSFDKRSLKLVPLFSGLATADVEELTSGATVLSWPNDHPLYEAGDAVENLYVVLDGHVELSAEADGKRSVVEVVSKGTVLGDAALFTGGHFSMAARVLSGTTLLAIPADSFVTKLESRFDILLHMLSTMSIRLRMLVRQISELKLKTTAQRLGSFILSLPESSSGRAEVHFPYDKRLVAEHLGMKPESLSRALAKLARVGVESRPDNVVVVADVERLRQFCSEEDLP